MTTLAYTKGVLAFDSRITQGDDIVANINKGVKTADYIAAVSGDAAAIPAFTKWVKAGLEPDKKPKELNKLEYTAIVVDRKGTVFAYEEIFEGPMEIESKSYAAGTGRMIAYGAMHVGASAKDAVIAAASYDKNTGGRVRELSFKNEKS